MFILNIILYKIILEKRIFYIYNVNSWLNIIFWFYVWYRVYVVYESVGIRYMGREIGGLGEYRVVVY